MSQATRTASRKRVSDTVVVIPTYREAGNIVELLQAVRAALDCDIIVVDDDSPDGTAELVNRHFGDDPRLEVIVRRDRPRGLGPAYRRGFSRALERGHDFVIQMDADFSHPPQALPQLRQAAEQADVVIGSRYVSGGRWEGLGALRSLLSRAGSGYARLVLGLPIRDVTGGFKCWRAASLLKVDVGSVTANGFAFQIEMNHRAHRRGLRLLEVPIRFHKRRHGESKMSLAIVVEGFTAVWRLRGSR